MPSKLKTTCTRLPTATPTAVHIPASRECRRLFLIVIAKLGPGLTIPRVATAKTVIQSSRNDVISGSLLWLEPCATQFRCSRPARIILRPTDLLPEDLHDELLRIVVMRTPVLPIPAPHHR